MILQRRPSLALLNDTPVLSHTRGVPVISVLKLVGIIHNYAPNQISQSRLAAEGKAAGIGGFSSYSSEGPMSTRIRHHWYALEQLELVKIDREARIKDSYCLSQIGINIAESANLLTYDDLHSLPLQTVGLMRDAVKSSKYVNTIWLSFFDCTADNLSQPVVLEKVATHAFCEELVDLSIYRRNTGRDSGYRIYPSANPHVWQDLCLYSDGVEMKSVSGFILSDTARKEIVVGVRKWCSEELDITVETPTNIPEGRYECVDTRVNIWRVTANLPSREVPIESLVDVVHQMIRTIGFASRITVPSLLTALIEKYGISLANAKSILEYIYFNHGDTFYFEGVSYPILQELKVPRYENYYLWLGGAWRASVRLW